MVRTDKGLETAGRSLAESGTESNGRITESSLRSRDNYVDKHRNQVRTPVLGANIITQIPALLESVRTGVIGKVGETVQKH
jgi:hypothetical protein